MDTVKTIAQTPEQWVTLACGKPKEKRPFLRFLHVIDGTMYGTNAQRMHWAKTEFPDGVYDPSSFMPIPFFRDKVPDFKKYAPEFTQCQWIASEEIKEAAPGPRGQDILRLNEEIKVDKTYLLEAMNGELSYGVFFIAREREGNRVIGMSNFGSYMLACIVDR